MDTLRRIYIHMEPILEESEAWTDGTHNKSSDHNKTSDNHDGAHNKTSDTKDKTQNKTSDSQTNANNKSRTNTTNYKSGSNSKTSYIFDACKPPPGSASSSGSQRQKYQEARTAPSAVDKDNNKKHATNTATPAGCDTEKNDTKCVEKYQNHFTWLKDAKFLAELENDSVDSDIIEEELHALQEEELPSGSRQKVIKFLQSNPVQILLCVVVLLDAGIVIAQILLDLHSVREKLHRREDEVSSLVHYIRGIKAAELASYNGSDVHHILHILEHVHYPLDEHLPAHAAVDPHHAPPAHGTAYVNTSQHGAGDPSYNGTSDGAGGGTQFVDTYVEHEEQDLLHEVAHGLHFASIALLGFLVIEDAVKIIAMGKLFFKHKIEIFDAIIIVSSFVIDVVFLGEVMGEEGSKAAAVLVVLLLWRIARVVDGILITVKQRQEFRIRLQKRARRKAEKRIDNLEEEKHSKSRQIQALKDLCNRAGVRDYDIDACTPRPPRRVSTTVCALSSVARLSISMTMSMSSGLFSLGGDDGDGDKGDKTTPPVHETATSPADLSPGGPKDQRSVFFKRENNGGGHGGKSKSSPLLSLKNREWGEGQSQGKKDETSFNDVGDRDKPSGSGRFGSPRRFFNRSLSSGSSPPGYKGSPSKAKRSPGRGGKHSKSPPQPPPLRHQERPTFHLSPPTSPINSSGVEIVIEPGTDTSNSMSPPHQHDPAHQDPHVNSSAPETSPQGTTSPRQQHPNHANCDYLTVGHATFCNDDGDSGGEDLEEEEDLGDTIVEMGVVGGEVEDNSNSCAATASQVHLLSEMEH